MNGLVKRLAFGCGIVLATLSLVGCQGGGNTAASMGTLQLSLVDKPGVYEQVVVNIDEVQVHHETMGWETLSGANLNVPMEVNLPDLVNGTVAYLGATELQTGHYTQMRLILHNSGNYLVDGSGEEHSLKVPSGGTTGVKLVDGFDITAAGATELVLDFDVSKSIVQAGNSGQYLLKPTIKVVDTVTNSVSGVVDGLIGDDLPSDVKVSAQKYAGDGILENEADRVTIAASTQPDGQGDYFMYLPLLDPQEDPYNIVATLSGYVPECLKLQAGENANNMTGAQEANFTLEPIAGDAVTFSATVTGLAADTSITVSIRQQDSDCGLIEAASSVLTNTEDTELVTLPAGDYQVVLIGEDGSTIDSFDTGDVSGPYLIEHAF